ncbi:MAG: protocadherin [Pirellulales bacterium]
MSRSLHLVVGAALAALATMYVTADARARGFAGAHVGGVGGGFHGGMGGGMAGGFGGGGIGAGGLGAGGFGGAGLSGAGLGPGGFAGGAGRAPELGGDFGAGDFGGRGIGGGGLGPAGVRPDGLGPGGLGAGGLGGAGLSDRAGSLGAALSEGGTPSRGQLSNFLNLPSDNGMHALSGAQQGRFSQALDNAQTGDGPLGNRLSGETQSRLSQLSDQARQGDGPLDGQISGETQSRLSQAYDNVRAGDGPFKNYIPGETQKPLSRLYDDIRAGNHPFQPISPWIAHNNAVVVRRNFNNYYFFTPDWYRRYPGAWYPARWAYGSPWVYAPWATLGVWLGCAAGEPIYYDYGNNVVLQDNSVYVNGEDAGSTAEYFQQAQELAANGAGDQSDGQWMSLGVFAISAAGQTSADSVVQLAVNLQGVIRGNMTNTKTNQTLVVQGSVDKQKELAAWTCGENSNTVFETGIYNLTKDETTVLVHYGDGTNEQLMMVRLNQQGHAAGDATSNDATSDSGNQ